MAVTNVNQGGNPLGTEKIGKLIVAFGIPSVISQVVNALYNIVDQIFIGQGVGYLGNGATSVIMPLTVLAMALALLIDQGAASYLSLKLGERDEESAAKGVGNAIFGFYNDIADRFWRMIDYIYTLPQDVIVYILMHEECNDMGEYKPKTIGKILDEKVCLEGMFTIVLRCITQDGKHYFKTKTDGTDVSKSPPDMFSSELIDNDLKAVDTAIREYYELGGILK